MSRSPPLGPHRGGDVDEDGIPSQGPPQLTLRETAIDACSRKEHAVNRGYYRDPFLACFTGDNTYVNSPLMNRGYWLRVKAVESAVNRFLEMFPEDPIQIISLGGGYDTLFFRWAAAACSKRGNTSGTAAGSDLALPSCPTLGEFGRLHRYVEIDHGEVIRGKREIVLAQAGLNDLAHIKSDQELQMTDKERHEHSNCVYRIVDADLCEPAKFVEALTSPAKAQASCVIPTEHDSGHSVIDPTMPTLILAECVLVYMTAQESTALLKSITESVFPNNSAPVVLLSYDAIQPDDRFGKVMVETLSSRGIPLKGIKDLKTPQDHEARAASVGFNAVRSQSMKHLYDTVPMDDRRQLDQIERIDDWDEWALLHNHYCLTFAGRLSQEQVDKRGGHMPNLFLGTTRSDHFTGGGSPGTVGGAAGSTHSSPGAVKNESFSSSSVMNAGESTTPTGKGTAGSVSRDGAAASGQ